jgi:hypothetical protein
VELSDVGADSQLLDDVQDFKLVGVVTDGQKDCLQVATLALCSVVM